ncbi:hydroxyisourate hydrolase [Paenibacillus sp. MBLB2552]|uniref:5-hydroxyisourate hydrolase n=1 Tax=Paenibacillus mellifer TaxID=2937794 RepID=A0A9X2BMZ8_9BACL|nr:hydroxyisourate hydrolase [Paenibacillus mellifer]MCK8486274.1 hydroxyisourate hydrolase [Paenibacillus mellifer]
MVRGQYNRLTTHVLDLARGVPAVGMHVELRRLEGEHRPLLRSARTNAEGRLDVPLLEGPEMTAGEYELLFDAEDYFTQMGQLASVEGMGEPGFLRLIPIRFHISAEGGHYHVPLLLAPGGYSTYRGG